MYPIDKQLREDPPRRATWQYSSSTTTSILRAHLTRLHMEAYTEATQRNGWKHDHLDRVLRQSGQLEPSSTLVRPRVPFTQKAFIDYLIQFIVANDQVSPLLRFIFVLNMPFFSLFTLLNVVNFVTSSCFLGSVSWTKIFHAVPR